MKAIKIIQEFLIDFSDCQTSINVNTTKKWFENSKYFISVSKTVKYEFFDCIKYFSIENDGYIFKIDWIKVKKHFATDPEFLKHLENINKKGKV